ncbi:MAG TPA: hypothetical protein PLE81_09285 [Brevundimonas sp.]|jgi:hypothetical protein|uniref:hypothetical protein n=1 Tax=Brevundimonas sp. TaxID=1871086 RepID=UPI002B5CA06C|nr:hypothetical protein [Brevundimonas sp.]HRH20815.1 hypothetical protein [Brevundimonas sp.]
MIFSLVLISALSLMQIQPGSIADQASRPLWILAEDAATLAMIDRAPSAVVPAAPVDLTFWLFLENSAGYDTMAAAITVDCAARTFVHRSFAAFNGPAFVGATAAQDTSSQTAEPGTYYGAMVAHVCDPSPESGRGHDFANFQAAGAARPAFYAD